MKWKKLGKIFNPLEHNLPNGCIDFAQSPQTLIFDDFVRIYFSARQKDKSNGKYLSHVVFVDMDKSFQKVKKISDETIIELGELGSFDEHGIFPFHVIRNQDKIFAYTCGWSRRISVSVETSVGLAISYDNGLTFKKIGSGPILASSLNEPFLVGDAFVRVYKARWHMWYIYGTKWFENDVEEPARVYKITHATSSDGFIWQKEGKRIIADKLNENECQALPSVIFAKGLYHMFFCYRQPTGFRNNKERSYRIGYAFSNDLINWTRDDDNAGIDVSKTGWDSEMICYPHVFSFNDKTYMLYNGNEFGKAGFGLAVAEN